MNLLKYRIMNFRAIIDTGWIECPPVTAFVGANESGKTTLLIALMKLMDPKHVQRSGDTVFKSNIGKLCNIVLSDDIPIDREDELKGKIDETVFIEAVFSTDENVKMKLAELGGGSLELPDTVYITKTLGGIYSLPELFPLFAEERRSDAVNIVLDNLPFFLYFKEVTEIKSEINFVELAYKLTGLRKVKTLTPRESLFANLLNFLDIWNKNLIKSIEQVHGKLDSIKETDIDFCRIFEEIPLFKDRLTRGFTNLSLEFRKWWGNNEITIDYEVYKKGIKIRFVDMSGKPFYLENRSTGFRRFFTLFLSFSVVSRLNLENAILLFDEAGAALHPLMQRKLAYLFRELSKNTQLLYNTHSSYMLPISEMDSARIVYKDISGHINITTSMQLFKERTNEESLFVAQSALAMHLAESALIGCWPIVVLSKEDMFYLQAMKLIMVARGKLNTIYETLIFSAGENGIDAVSELYGGNGFLPVVLLMSDEKSRAVKERLINGRYKNCPAKVYEISDFDKNAVCLEDLIPPKFWQLFIKNYLYTLLDKDFQYNPEKPMLQQIDEYAKEKNIMLSPRYRIEMAKAFKLNVVESYHDQRVPFGYSHIWLKMLKTLLKDRGEDVECQTETTVDEMLKWKAEYEIGEPAIDYQHRQLFKAINDLNTSCNDGSGPAVLRQSMDFIVDYVVRHFKEEEELQLKINYPDREHHKMLHENFKLTVGSLMQKFIEQGATKNVCNEVNQVLAKWLLIHVQNEDSKIGAFMRGETIGEDPANAAKKKTPKPFTLSRNDVLDHIEKMQADKEKFPENIAVSKKGEEAHADIFMCGDRAFTFMYERNEMIFSFTVRLDDESAKQYAEHIKIQPAEYPSKENWYDVTVDRSFSSKKEVYKLLEKSYAFTLQEFYASKDAAAAEEARQSVIAEQELIAAMASHGALLAGQRSEKAEEEYLIALTQYKALHASAFTITRKEILDDFRAMNNPLIETKEHPASPQLSSMLKYKGKAFAMLYRGNEDSCRRMSVMLEPEYAEELANLFPEVCRAKFPQGKFWYYVPVEAAFLSKTALYEVLAASRDFLEKRLEDMKKPKLIPEQINVN